MPAPDGGITWAIGLSIAWFAIPLTTGALIGRLLRPRLGGRTGKGAVVGAPLVVVAVAVAAVQALPVWDLVGLSLAFSAAALLAANRPSTWSPGRVAVSVGLFVAVAEGSLRVLDLDRPVFPPPSAARVLIPPSSFDAIGAALFPDRFPERVPESLRHASDAPRRVLHLGDSMVRGDGVEPSETFTAELARRDPATAHLNAGFSGTSIDFQLGVLRAYLPRVRPTEVVLYVYAGNDLRDIDEPYTICGGGPVLGRDAATRCTEPDWRLPLRERMARHPPPYPLRVATCVSVTAQHLAGAFADVVSRVFRANQDPPPPPDAWERARQILGAMQDELAAEGVGLQVVVIPQRFEVDSDDDSWWEATVRRHDRDRIAGHHEGFLELAAELGIPTHDPRQFLDGLIAEVGFDRVYLHDGEHFSPEAHARMASWLEQELR